MRITLYFTRHVYQSRVNRHFGGFATVMITLLLIIILEFPHDVSSLKGTINGDAY